MVVRTAIAKSRLLTFGSVVIALALAACGSTASSATAPPASVAPAKPAPSISAATKPAPSISPATKPDTSSSGVSSAPKPSVSGAPSAQLSKLAIGSVTSPAVLLPLFYAQDKGIFNQFGIEPTVQVINGGSVPLGAAISGELQILSISAEGIPADLQGADFVYIYSPLPAPPFSLYAKPQITDVVQLKGKAIGVTSLNSSSEALAKFALQKAGVAPGETKILNTGSPPNSLAALMGGSVDAAVFSPPATFDADAKGFHPIFNGFDGGFNYLATASLTKKSYAAANHALILNYVKAMVTAEAGITKDKAGAVAALSRVTKSNDQKTLNGTYDFYSALFQKYQVPAPSVEAVQAALNNFAVTVPAAKTADPKSFIDTEFVNELDSSGFIKQAYGG